MSEMKNGNHEAAKEDLRFPIGLFTHEGAITDSRLREWIRDIKEAPVRLRASVEGLSEAQLDTPYRPEGWTVRQVVHHLADSHMNSYIRMKLALTEDRPVIKPYDEGAWALLADGKELDIAPSLRLLEAIHARWEVLLEALTEDDWNRSYIHPDSGTVSLARHAGIYSWHSRHHVAHIVALRKRMGWE